MDCTPADAAAGRNDCQKDLPTLGKPGQTEPPVDVSVIVSSPLHAGDAQDPSPTEHTSHPSPENVRTTYGNCSSSDKTDVGGDTQSIPVRSQDGRSAELLETIPWEDVLFRYVLTCLPLTDLFRLRATCRLAHECVSQFFTCCRYVNTNRYNNTMTAEAFKTVTHNNSCIQALLTRHAKTWLTDEVLMPVLESNTLLRKLDLTGCYYVSNTSVQKLATNCRELRELYLRDCHWMSKEAVLVLGLHCTKLHKLDLTGCWEISDESVVHLVMRCPKLQFLSVSKIYGIGDPAVRQIARCARCLKHLNLAGCWRVTDNAIRILGEYCKTLTALQVRECRDITEISLARLRVRGVKLDVQAHPWQMNPATRRRILVNM